MCLSKIFWVWTMYTIYCSCIAKLLRSWCIVWDRKRLLPSSTQLYTVINNIIRYPLCRWLAYRCNYRGYLPLPRMIRSFKNSYTTHQTIGFDLGCVLNTLWSTARQIIHSTTIKRDTEDVWLVSCYWITSQRYKFIHMIWLFNSSIEKCKACKANENNNIWQYTSHYQPQHKYNTMV